MVTITIIITVFVQENLTNTSAIYSDIYFENIQLYVKVSAPWANDSASP